MLESVKHLFLYMFNVLTDTDYCDCGLHELERLELLLERNIAQCYFSPVFTYELRESICCPCFWHFNGLSASNSLHGDCAA